MAQVESHFNNMGYGPQPADEFGGEDKEQTQKFIKIITTFASRVDISVCKAQLTIDVLLSQYNIPLAPKEAIVDDTSSSKIKSVMAVIRRAAILQRDVERLGQLLISRHPQQNLFSHSSEVQQQHEDPRQIPPGSPKTTARISPVAAAQAKPASSLLAKSLSTSVIPNSASPPSGGLTKQTSFSSTPPALSKSGPPPPKQYMAAPPPPSNAAATPSPPSHLSSTPPSHPNAGPAKPMLKKAAPPQRFQSSPALNPDTPLRSSFDSSPTPSPPSTAASSPSNSFLSSTPPPSMMVKAVLKSTPLKKPPAVHTGTGNAGPPSPASTPPSNGTFGAKRPLNTSSPSPHDFSEPTPLSSEGLTDDSEIADSDTAQSSTPPSSLNVAEFGAVPVDDQTPVEPPGSLPISDDLDALELDDDDDDSIYEEPPKDKVEKFDSVKIKKDINALLDEIDKEEATPAKRVNPGIKDMLSPFFTKRPKNKQEMETNLKDKGIVPREDKKNKK